MESASSTAAKAKSASGYEGAGPIGLVALLRQGLDEFLAFPLWVVAGFLALAALTLWLDSSGVPAIASVREHLGRFVFVTATSTASVLGQLLGGLLTVISITFSALLLAVQQTATTLSNQVYSQFLRRRINQLYFGFFLGLALYDVAALAAAHPHFNPVYSASVAVVMTSIGLCLLIVVIYSTVDQMRPSVIVESVRDHTLAARAASAPLLARTRREPSSRAPVQATVFAVDDGFLQRVMLDRIEDLLRPLGPDAELQVLPAIGDFVAYDDRLALVRAHDRAAAEGIVDDVRRALVLHGVRDLKRDAAFGIVQLESIAWTTASSAKSTPGAPRMVIHALRDLLGRWIAEPVAQDAKGPALPIVIPDRMHRNALDALVTIGLASDESRQHVVIATAFDALAQLLPRAERGLRAHVIDGIRTLIPALSDLPLAGGLQESLSRAADALQAAGVPEVASEIRTAAAAMQARKGRLRAQ